MSSKIKSVSIICHQGVKQYFVGEEHNGLTIDRIEDWSIEWPDGIDHIFKGLTKNGVKVFEVINAPVDVCYFKEE